MKKINIIYTKMLNLIQSKLYEYFCSIIYTFDYCNNSDYCVEFFAPTFINTNHHHPYHYNTGRPSLGVNVRCTHPNPRRPDTPSPWQPLTLRPQAHYYSCHPYQYSLLTRCGMYATHQPTSLFRPTLIFLNRSFS